MLGSGVYLKRRNFANEHKFAFARLIEFNTNSTRRFIGF
ncbi:hypothetical protein CAMRE0001_0149 [Campylobacter rectus RM3267]|uniref:Uncharacterized protein n=1 Tax=Campylobacter rectus RM3267 TaxID=553218 RepID=B9CXV9_CAMRE|nr:hypothetical protein CAMRE0001_0149 [Campylobacter rectus RM3267]